jgi:cardiolipin synthase
VAPASPPAARRLISAVLAAAMLALAGCRPVTVTVSGTPPAGTHPASAAAPAPASGTAAPAVAGADALITEPGAGFGRVYGLINGAAHSVDMTMYELADTTAEHDLAAAARRGALVRVILDGRQRSENSPAYQYLRAHGANVAWSSPRFTYTHQKTLVIDHSTAVILTANLTSRYYSTSRDFAVIDSAPADVVEDALIAAARRGVQVQACGENEYGEDDSAFARLARAGVQVSYYSSPDGFYIHGKVIEADFGTSRARVFIGSENFSATSLGRNRKLGLVLASRAVLTAVARTFSRDFRGGRHWR